MVGSLPAEERRAARHAAFTKPTTGPRRPQCSRVCASDLQQQQQQQPGTPQQRTRIMPLLLSIYGTDGRTDRRTDRRTPHRFMDPALHTMPTLSEMCAEELFYGCRQKTPTAPGDFPGTASRKRADAKFLSRINRPPGDNMSSRANQILTTRHRVVGSG